MYFRNYGLPNTLSYFLITIRKIELENVSLSDMVNLRTVC